MTVHSLMPRVGSELRVVYYRTLKALILSMLAFAVVGIPNLVLFVAIVILVPLPAPTSFLILVAVPLAAAAVLLLASPVKLPIDLAINQGLAAGYVVTLSSLAVFVLPSAVAEYLPALVSIPLLLAAVVVATRLASMWVLGGAKVAQRWGGLTGPLATLVRPVTPLFALPVVISGIVSIFSSITFALYTGGLITLDRSNGSSIVTVSDTISMYLWYMLNLIPGLDVVDTFNWSAPPVRPDSWVSGGIVVLFQVCLLVPIVHAAKRYLAEAQRVKSDPVLKTELEIFRAKPFSIWRLFDRHAVHHGDAQRFALRADMHLAKGESEDAIEDLNRAIELEPTAVWAYAERGRAHRAAQHLSEALHDLTRAIELDPTIAAVHALRGETRHELGDLTGAISDLRHAVELDPTSAWAYGELGRAHRAAGDNPSAIAGLVRAIELDPTVSWPYGELGRTRCDIGQPTSAVADFTRALELDPTDAWALAQRGHAYQMLERSADAIADLTAALSLDPAMTQILPERAAAHLAVGNLGAAIADMNRVVELDRDSADGYVLRGAVRLEAGENDEAIADLTRALELSPELSAVRCLRGTAHLLAEDPDAAILDLRAAVEADPADHWMKTLLIVAYELVGAADQAAPHVADFTTCPLERPGHAGMVAAWHHSLGHGTLASEAASAALDLHCADDWDALGRALGEVVLGVAASPRHPALELIDTDPVLGLLTSLPWIRSALRIGPWPQRGPVHGVE